jgi:hypothetical protein
MATVDCKTAFKPSRNGFHFKNHFSGPFTYLCGGMVWASLDRFFGNVNQTIPDLTIDPAEGSALYNEILRRQFDIFRGVELPVKLMDWMERDDKDHPGFWHEESIGSLTQGDEWPAIRSLIDAGYPVSMVLVTVRSDKFLDIISQILDPLDIVPDVLDPIDVLKNMSFDDNHVVLATGYILDESTGKLSISVYDPNYPNDDSVTISIVLGQEDSALSARHSKGDHVRGFFNWPYDNRMVLVTEEEAEAQVDPADMSWWVVFE